MQFTTLVSIPEPPFRIGACERMLFVGSCFAANIGQRFVDDKFRAVVNPFGVMYNPASILHTVRRLMGGEGADKASIMADISGPHPRVAVFTLGTNHVYRLKETGEIVDNCQKRPQRLFQEEQLSVEQCADYLLQAIGLLPTDCHVVLTVSPIRYRKYGYHGSRLSKATLLLAANQVAERLSGRVCYFPAYEIMDDELRDYRFYAPDMLHPSEQAVDYIFERFQETFFSDTALAFLAKWKPLRAALSHRPFNPDGEDYKKFRAETKRKVRELQNEYPDMP